MLLLRLALHAAGIALVSSAGFVALYRTGRKLLRGTPAPMGTAFRLSALGGLSLFLGQSLVLVPTGMAGVRVSQVSGTLPGTLYSGVHLIKPLFESVVLYDTRERVLTLSSTGNQKVEALRAQSKEGLAVGLAVTVRYRLDPERLGYIHANLPLSPEEQLVPPIVGSAFRELIPNYMVREVFATRREELRARAADIITKKLLADAILVKEVMLRDISLPPEYAKGLEGLLLKEQENERMVYDLQVKEKQVRAAELEAEAAKARSVKQAEAQAQVHVLQAKAEADAMQHTLPLKEKQIQQSHLEAQARKEATLMNADAAAQARLIESKAEVERMRLIADADANRIRVTSSADAQRLGQEAAVLKENPLLIQKIVAERLSDKMQIMMVPMDGQNFFANDVFRAASTPLLSSPSPAPGGGGAKERRVVKRQ